MKKVISLGVVFGSMPFLALALDSDINAWSILGRFNNILNTIIPILITLAVVYFIWGVIQYTVSSDEEAKKNARKKIIAGLIGLFIIVAFWGIIALITNTFGVGPEQLDPNAIPCIQGPGMDCGL